MNTFELNRLKKTAIDDLTTDETSSQHTRRRILKIDYKANDAISIQYGEKIQTLQYLISLEFKRR